MAEVVASNDRHRQIFGRNRPRARPRLQTLPDLTPQVRSKTIDTPVELNETADLVYTGRGAVNWIHDIEAWANIVERLLRQGGVLSLLEDHPASWLFSQESERLEASGLNYFAYAEASQGWTDEYIGTLGKPAVQHAIKYERLWTIADVFQALVKAGLVVEYLGEHSDEYWSAFPKLDDQEKSKIPMTYSIVARKPI